MPEGVRVEGSSRAPHSEQCSGKKGCSRGGEEVASAMARGIIPWAGARGCCVLPPREPPCSAEAINHGGVGCQGLAEPRALTPGRGQHPGCAAVFAGETQAARNPPSAAVPALAAALPGSAGTPGFYVCCYPEMHFCVVLGSPGAPPARATAVRFLPVALCKPKAGFFLLFLLSALFSLIFSLLWKSDDRQSCRWN